MTVYALIEGDSPGLFLKHEDLLAKAAHLPPSSTRRRFKNSSKAIAFLRQHGIISPPPGPGHRGTYYAANFPDGCSEIFRIWKDCKIAISGLPGVTHKKFKTLYHAKRFISKDDDSYISAETKAKFLMEYKSRHTHDQIVKQRDAPVTRVYCDGCFLNDGRCGYGVWFGANDKRNVKKPVLSTQLRSKVARSSYTAEVYAVLSALVSIRAELHECKNESYAFIPKYVVYTDSEVVINMLTTYAKNGAQGKGLIPELEEAISHFRKVREWYWERSEIFNGHQFKVEWVKGHAGEVGNERADELAKLGAMKSDKRAQWERNSA